MEIGPFRKKYTNWNRIILKYRSKLCISRVHFIRCLYAQDSIRIYNISIRISNRLEESILVSSWTYLREMQI